MDDSAKTLHYVMEIELLLGWKPLNLKRYDGTTDPEEHLDVFLT